MAKMRLVDAERGHQYLIRDRQKCVREIIVLSAMCTVRVGTVERGKMLADVISVMVPIPSSSLMQCCP